MLVAPAMLEVLKLLMPLEVLVALPALLEVPALLMPLEVLVALVLLKVLTALGVAQDAYGAGVA